MDAHREDIDWNGFFDMHNEVPEAMNSSAAFSRCKPCDKSFKSVLSLKLHVQQTHSNPLVCWVCSKAFFENIPGVNAANRGQHLRTVHNVDLQKTTWSVKEEKINDRMPCPVCLSEIEAAKLNEHMEKSHPCRCPKCFSLFQTSGSRLIHMRTLHTAVEDAAEAPKIRISIVEDKNKELQDLNSNVPKEEREIDWDEYFDVKDETDPSKLMNTCLADLTRCTPCGKKFRSVLALRFHVEQKHWERVVCWLCSESFNKKHHKNSAMSRRIRHTHMLLHKVDLTSFVWSLREEYRQAPAGETEVPCPICKRFIKQRFDLHMETSHPLECSRCFETFSSGQARKVHEARSHQKESPEELKRLRRQEVKQDYKNLGAMTNHEKRIIREVMREKRKFEYARKEEVKSADKRSSEVLVGKEKKIKLDAVCKEKKEIESAEENGSLAETVKEVKGTVEGDKKRNLPFICSICKKAHRLESGLLYHLRVIHGCTVLDNEQVPIPESEPIFKFVCSLCNHKVKERSTLQTHLKNTHGYYLLDDDRQVPIPMLSLTCSVCGKKTKTRSAIIQHLKHNHGYIVVDNQQVPMPETEVEMWTCPFCPGKVFRRKKRFLAHMQIQHPLEDPEKVTTEKIKLKNDRGTLENDKVTLKSDNGTTKKKPRYCKSCQIEFRAPIDFMHHRIGIPQKIYPCSQCMAVLQTECILLRHIREHFQREAKEFVRLAERPAREACFGENAELVCSGCGNGFGYDAVMFGRHQVWNDGRVAGCKLKNGKYLKDVPGIQAVDCIEKEEEGLEASFEAKCLDDPLSIPAELLQVERSEETEEKMEAKKEEPKEELETVDVDAMEDEAFEHIEALEDESFEDQAKDLGNKLELIDPLQ